MNDRNFLVRILTLNLPKAPRILSQASPLLLGHFHVVSLARELSGPGRAGKLARWNQAKRYPPERWSG